MPERSLTELLTWLLVLPPCLAFCTSYPIILCFPPGVQCETTAEVDIVLLVDGFGSFDPTTFTTIKSFLARLVRAFDIGPDKVQIGESE